MKQKFDVTGMTCSACSAHVEKSVSKLPGVNSVAVNLLQNTMLVDYDTEKLNDGQISAAVKAGGYGATPQQTAKAARGAAKPAAAGSKAAEEMANTRMRLISSFIFLVPLLLVSMGHMMGMPLPGFLTGMPNAIAYAMTQLLLTLPIIYVNRR